MQTFRVVGVLLVALGGALAWVAVRGGGLAWLALWPAVSFVIAGGAYVAGAPAPFGKRADGSMSLVSVAALFPYLALNWALWHVMRMRWKRAPSHQIAPGLWLGQRPLPGELPAGTTLVVDLTCEFRAHPEVLAGTVYRCLPTLDGRAPDERELASLVAEIVAHDGVAYVHCAAGHGRSAVVVACVLIARGLAADEGDALRRLRAIRPTVSLTEEQRERVRRFGAPR